jgi:hypothetical protein
MTENFFVPTFTFRSTFAQRVECVQTGVPSFVWPLLSCLAAAVMKEKLYRATQKIEVRPPENLVNKMETNGLDNVWCTNGFEPLAPW